MSIWREKYRYPSETSQARTGRHTTWDIGETILDQVAMLADDLPDLARRMEEADAVILGTTSYFRHGNEMTSALLDRLASSEPYR